MESERSQAQRTNTIRSHVHEIPRAAKCIDSRRTVPGAGEFVCSGHGVSVWEDGKNYGYEGGDSYTT